MQLTFGSVNTESDNYLVGLILSSTAQTVRRSSADNTAPSFPRRTKGRESSLAQNSAQSNQLRCSGSLGSLD
ncbi:hypothetical protein [Pseudomonas phage Eisa9]|uniref:Uncharacterized protein n=1 Tax=Pseudomonas phage Eisa9 TaxID=2900148 RepID=A0AAE8YJ19_9CAUD|nr:hypothetical protein [Pseudomonas phage Eisa9]